MLLLLGGEKVADYRFRFPRGVKKAFTLSYDDGQVFDRRLVDMFDRYHLKATFHLNSGTLGCGNEKDEFIKPDEVEELYDGHEVSAHGVNHPYFCQLSDGMVLDEIYNDKLKLEEYSASIVRGMSYPFGEFSDRVINIAMAAGMEYSRTVNDTKDFNIPDDFMRWNPSCHHNDADKLLDRFLNPQSYQDLLLFYVWGHSFEFDRENTWDMMEEFCKKISGHEDVWYATNIEIKDYISAMRSVRASADQKRLYNPSGFNIYLEYNNKIYVIGPNETITL